MYDLNTPEDVPVLDQLQYKLPFLAGHSFSLDKMNLPNHRKSHAFDYKNTVTVFKSDSPGIGGIPLFGQEENKIHTSIDVYPHSNEAGDGVPAWVAFDRKVLRFYAYFQEAVHEKREEQYRVRKCNIYFYLEDDTIHVSEPKFQNSGIPQGTLIRRHRIQKKAETNGQHYTVVDLNVEKEVTFYSKTFKIVGCDEFTRQFLSNLQIRVPANGVFPQDPYQNHRAELLSRMKATRPCAPKSSLKQFLENDRRVLRFYCIWDDTNSVFGDARHMVVHYYLSDDTVEIRESIPANSGRERNTLFLRRSKLPKRRVRFLYGQSSDSPDDYYSERDLTIGAVLHFYGRPFVICDCDEFTKDYYREKFGLDIFDPVRLEDYEEAPLEEYVPPKEKVVLPMLGGANESSHHRKKDLKMIQYDGICLRFLGVLKTTKQVDADRRFVISMYPVDGTVSVFEPHQRNSGIVGGKFLEKARIKRPDGETYYEAGDFYLGAEVKFHQHPFILAGADDYAVKYMNEHPEIWKPQNQSRK
ncbi:UNVERIFIED_CONTAM: EF-hand domain-containing member C2 [Siphonaria sp. JEL0065]|nr:EF-hand domain-containing member C2 [Siphonaria sp. JEL0065]